MASSNIHESYCDRAAVVMIAEKYARYSKLWFDEDLTNAMAAEMFAIVAWVKTVVATTRCDHEMVAAILYADATDGAGDLLEQPAAA